MSDSAIAVEHLSKTYLLGRSRNRHDGLRHRLEAALRHPWRWLGTRSREREAASQAFWALKDVSFEVKQGEVVGIIGRNGAGKSTLLKILSRITEPTEGRVRMRGRVASLLEVGTGFHPELTGRENIFLNGAILGMSARGDRTASSTRSWPSPRWRSSSIRPSSATRSGMYVRLAFAVAAHLEPEILIVDEVLAVGDAEFPEEVPGKMQEVGRHGRTVLFVTHNMTAITRLCPRAVLLDAGQLLHDGGALQVVSSYLSRGLRAAAAREWPDPARAPGNEIVRLRGVRVRTEDGKTMDAVDIRKPVGIEMEFQVLKAGHVLVSNCHFFNEEGTCVFVTHDWDRAWRRTPRPVGRYQCTAWIPGNFLAEGTLLVTAVVSSYDPIVVHFSERDAVSFQVVDTQDGDSARGDYAGHVPGVVRPLLRWTTEFHPPGATAPADRRSDPA